MILVIALIIAAPCSAAVWLFLGPEYQAKRPIWVKPVIPVVFSRTPGAGHLPAYDSYMNTQAILVRQQTVLSEVLEQASERKIDWLRADYPKGLPWHKRIPAFLQAPANIDRLQDSLEVKARYGTQLIEVTATAPKPDEAKFLADSIVEAYMLRVVAQEKLRERERYEKFSQARVTSQKVIDVNKSEINRIIQRLPGEEYRTSDLKKAQADVASTLQQARSKRSFAQVEREALTARLEALQNRPLDESGAEEEESTRQPLVYAEDPEWRRRHGKLDQLQTDLMKLTEVQELLEDHPTVKELKIEIKRAQKDLNEWEKVLEGLFARGASVNTQDGAGTFGPDRTELGLRAVLVESEMTIAALDRQIMGYEKVSKQLRKAAQEVELLERGIVDQEAVLKQSGLALEEREMEQKAAPARIEKGQPAILPRRPSRDRRVKLSVAAVLIGLIAGCGLAYVREAFDSSLKGPQDVRVSLDPSQFLGHLPQLRGIPSLPVGGSSPFDEDIRIIRTALVNRLKGVDGNALLITSSEPSAGKTTFSTHLAASFAGLKKRVLLVDADFHRGGLVRMYGGSTGPGLSKLLADRTSNGTDDRVQGLAETIGSDSSSEGLSELLARGDDSDPLDVVKESVLPNVNIVFTGAHSGAQDLLAGGEFEKHLTTWKQEYDLVIVDGPPLLGVADAQVLTGVVDHSVLLVRATHTLKERAQEACERIAAANGSLIGVVLNGVSRNVYAQSSYFSDYYSYGRKNV
jgi:Mrp family chromosome partitioning ATPase/uncharacterized protein involved in exopolysaccharide biosynthesis